MALVKSTQAYTATCHCKSTILHVTLPSLDSDSQPVISCNCSICTKHGLAVQYCRRKRVHFEAGEAELKNYFCGSRTRVLRFCGNCGVVMLFDAHGGGDVKEEETVVAINVSLIMQIQRVLNLTYLSVFFRFVPLMGIILTRLYLSHLMGARCPSQSDLKVFESHFYC
jgi:hypothetical protein